MKTDLLRSSIISPLLYILFITSITVSLSKSSFLVLLLCFCLSCQLQFLFQNLVSLFISCIVGFFLLSPWKISLLQSFHHYSNFSFSIMIVLSLDFIHQSEYFAFRFVISLIFPITFLLHSCHSFFFFLFLHIF